MIVSLQSEPQVRDRLLEYLRNDLNCAELSYAVEPTPITDGWETYIYKFQLRSCSGLPEVFCKPLILRVYSCGNGLPRLRHEFAVQRHMGALSYPIAQAIAFEQDPHWFGGPFMIMEQVSGETLLKKMLGEPWRILKAPGKMAEAHAQLHQLPVEGFPGPRGPFLSRHLEEMLGIIDEFELKGMRRGYEWLEKNRPRDLYQPRIIHLDFHPVNLMFYQDKIAAVLDWSEADLGDPHADVATTLVLIQSAPVEIESRMQQVWALPGRFMLYRRYLRAYRKVQSLDAHRLNYFMAWAAFRRLCRYGMWLRAGPCVTGSKPSSIRYLNCDRIRVLLQGFKNRAGVVLTLDECESTLNY